MNLATILDSPPSTAAALVGPGGDVTYGVLRARVAAVAQRLRSSGLGPGDRLAIIEGNSERFVVAHFAALAVGLVSVPLEASAPSAELARALERVRVEAIVVGPAGRAAVAALDPGCVVFDDVFDEVAGVSTPVETIDAVERAGDDVAVLLFTSGTCGAPRAAMLTHANLVANLEQVQRHPGRAATPADRCLAVVPLSHVFGLSSVLHLTVHAGGSVHLVERFEPAGALAAIRDLSLTVVVGPPPMWAALASVDGASPTDVASVRLAVSGASALPDHVWRLVSERLGLDVREGYGLTEAAPAVAMAAGTDAPPGSVGIPLPGVAVRLVDSGGDDVLIGDPGEVWVSGPNVFAGYLDDPETTAAVIDDQGWLHTGDIAIVDDDGYLSLVDRAKDLVIVSGFNVYPAEVEEALGHHPDVAAAAVVGVPDDRTGEAIVAYVVARPAATLDPVEVRAFCATQLARYKCPATVNVVTELPVRPDGKMVRRSLPHGS